MLTKYIFSKNEYNFLKFFSKPKVNWNSENLYERLGLKPTVTPEELKSKYHELVKAYHPDMIQDPKEKEESEKIISSINSAYDTLKDEQKRKQYDQQRTAGPYPFSPPNINIFRQAIHLTFLESIFGSQKTIKLDTTEICSKCNGNGTNDGKLPNTCHICHGSGFIPQGFFPIPCPGCGGRGFIINNPCNKCNGNGQTPKPSFIKLNIPSGVDQGSVLNFDVPQGRVILMCIVESDPMFSKDGRDLHITVPISIKTAMLGGKVKIPTLKGLLDKKVLPGTQPYDVEKLILNSPDGARNLYIHYRVHIPRSLNNEQKNLFEKIDEKFIKPINDLYNANLNDFERRLNEFKK